MRTSVASGGSVMKLTTPPTASEPYRVEPEPAQHFDAGDRFERHRDIQIVVAGLHVVHAHAVEQDQRLAEAGAADREVGLDAVGRALAEVERRVEPEQVHQSVEHQPVVARR